MARATLPPVSESGDPFASVTPIGRAGGGVSGLSGRENRMRRYADHSELPAPAALQTTDPGTGQPKEPPASKPRRRSLRSTLTTDEAKAMAEKIARRAYRDATTLEKASDRKHAAASFGIAIDKHTMLSGRPTQITELRAEERAGLLELARQLLGDGAA